MTETETLRLILFLIVFYHLVKWGYRLSEQEKKKGVNNEQK